MATGRTRRAHIDADYDRSHPDYIRFVETARSLGLSHGGLVKLLIHDFLDDCGRQERRRRDLLAATELELRREVREGRP
jgi:hypothetical protein